MVPALVAAVVVRGEAWVPVSDLALIDLRLRDVGSADTPLLGPFSRFGWSHPGPLLFWLLAPVYRVLGAEPTSGLAAAALQNAAVLVAIGVVARRVGGRAFAIGFALPLAVLVASMGGQLLASTWNPWIALLPFALFVLLAWGVSGGDRWLAPWAVGVGSYLVQSHVGYGLLVGALGAVALGLAVATHRRAGGFDPARTRPGRPAAAGPDDETDLPAGGTASGEGDRTTPGAEGSPAPGLLVVGLVSLAVALVCWAGPLVDQATEDPGNLRAVVSYFTTGSDDEPVGASVAGTVLGRELAPWGPWAGGPEPLDFLSRLTDTSPALALPLALVLVAGATVAWRRRHLAALRLQALAVTGVAAGAFAVTRITDLPYHYLFRWWWVLAMVTWVAALWPLLVAGAAALGDEGDRRADGGHGGGPGERTAERTSTTRSGDVVRRTLAATTAAATLVAAAVGVVAATDTLEGSVHEAAVASLAPQVVEELRSSGAVGVDPETGEPLPYLVTAEGFSWFEVQFGLLDALDAAGIDVAVEEGLRAHAGPGRVVGDGPGGTNGTLVVASGTAVDELRRRIDPSSSPREIATYDPLDPAERAELDRLQAEQAERLVVGGRDDLVPRLQNAGAGLLAGETDLVDPTAVVRIAELLERGDRVSVFLD